MPEKSFLILQVVLGLLGVVALVSVAAGGWRGRRVQFLTAVAVVLLCGGLLVLLSASRGRSAGVAACAARLHQLGSAVELYAQSNDGQCPPSLDYLVPFYFEDLPVCPVVPAGQANPYQEGYRAAGSVFTVQCQGTHHRGLGGCASGFPRFVPAEGVQTAPFSFGRWVEDGV